MRLRLLHPWFGLYPRRAEYQHNGAPARDSFADGSVSVNGSRYNGGGEMTQRDAEIFAHALRNTGYNVIPGVDQLGWHLVCILRDGGYLRVSTLADAKRVAIELQMVQTLKTEV